MSIEQFSLFSGVVSICFAFWLRQNVAKTSEGNAKMIEIAEAIREGARAFLKREFKAIVWAGALLAIILYFSQKPNGLMVATGFIIGALASALAAFVGMQTVGFANSRVAEAARGGMKSAFSLAFRGGAVTGFLVV